MFNLAGEVIGIVSHIVSKSGGSEGLGFVVTSNMARRLLFDEPSVWNGLEGYLLAGDVARAFNIPPRRTGLLVQRVAENSPAEQLGLRGGSLPARIGDEYLLLGGDVILAVDGIGLATSLEPMKTSAGISLRCGPPAAASASRCCGQGRRSS